MNVLINACDNPILVSYLPLKLLVSYPICELLNSIWLKLRLAA
jgi:hypothetical protein